MSMKTAKAAKRAKSAMAASIPKAVEATQQTVTTVTTVTTVGPPPVDGAPPVAPVATATGAGKKRWAYAYQILPPQNEEKLEAVKALIEKEMAEAKKDARTWQGRFIPESLVTHLLVVTEDPEKDAERNARLEAALTELKTTFVRTAPFMIEDAVELGERGSKLAPMLEPLIEIPKAKSGKQN